MSSLERGLRLFCVLGCKATSFTQEIFIPHGSIQSAAGIMGWQRRKRNGFGLTVKVAGVVLRLQLGDELSLLPQQPVPVQMEEEGMVLHLMCPSCQAKKPVSGAWGRIQDAPTPRPKQHSLSSTQSKQLYKNGQEPCAAFLGGTPSRTPHLSTLSMEGHALDSRPHKSDGNQGARSPPEGAAVPTSAQALQGTLPQQPCDQVLGICRKSLVPFWPHNFICKEKGKGVWGG